MFGPDTLSSISVNADSGIVPRVCCECIDFLSLRRTSHMDYKLSISYIEVFGEKVYDLLRGGVEVGAWHGIAARAVQDGQAQVNVCSRDDIQALLKLGEKSKRFSSTAMNVRSSRAHTVVTLMLVKSRKPAVSVLLDDQLIKSAPIISKLCMVDLGGTFCS